MTKIALVSDQHLHKFKPFSTSVEYMGRQMNSRLVMAARASEKAWEMAAKLGADFIINCGDFFDEKGKIDIETLNVGVGIVNNFMCGYKREMVFIPGNHDLTASGASSVDPLSQINGVSVLRNIVTTCNDVSIVTHVFNSKFKTEDLELLEDGADLLVLHQSPDGAVDGTYTVEGFDPNDPVLDRYGTVVCGHIHQPQRIGKVQVLGSVLQIRKGDTGDRGFWMWEDGELEFYPLDFPKFIELVDPEPEELEKHLNINYCDITYINKTPTKEVDVSANTRVMRSIEVGESRINGRDPVEVYVEQNPDANIDSEELVRTIRGYLENA